MFVKSATELVSHWNSTNSLIATAYEFPTGDIKINDNQPCHRSFRRGYIASYLGHGDYMNPTTKPSVHKPEDITGAYVKLSYSTSTGYTSHGGGVEDDTDPEYRKACVTWFEFLVSKDGPWRTVDAKILYNSKGLPRALYIPDVHKQEMQPWLNMCFATRAAPQRKQAIKLWYHLITKHEFHPVEALYIIHGLMYDNQFLNYQVNPLNYDWLFKGYNIKRASFYNLWNGTPQIALKGTINKQGTHCYGEPNDIWVETCKERIKATDFLSRIKATEQYSGAFAQFHNTYTGQDEFDGSVHKPDKCIELIKKEVGSWPRK